MNKKRTWLIFGFILLLTQGCGQSYKKQFNELVSKSDTLGQKKLLQKWEQVNSNDPELYVAYFNFYVRKSKKSIVRIDSDGKDKGGYQVMKEDSSVKEPVAYIYGDSYFDRGILQSAIEYIDRGIKKFPNRLDMRFGKIYMYGQANDYEKFTDEIIQTINYSATNKNKWTWKDSKPLDSPQQFFLSALQDYQVQLYETEKDELLGNMGRIAETVLKYYPDHIESLSNLSVVFMLQKQYDKGLAPLLKAEKLNPKDHIVLSNIAQAYKLKGDKKNAIKYYELTIKYGDEQAVDYAKSQLEELKKN
jgi:tetratricopeptide (TPR) repeat protein